MKAKGFLANARAATGHGRKKAIWWKTFAIWGVFGAVRKEVK
jgi:hypothetical protein